MKIKVSFDEINSALNVNFVQTKCTFNADFGEVFRVKTDEVYTGDYDVVPSAYDQQTLYTKDKLLTDNITVRVIPYAEAINLSGGYTATIG